MASLNGYGTVPMYGPAGTAGPSSGTPAAIPGSATGRGMVVIDGTPVRVVILMLAAAGGLWALKLAGVRFNVGVSA